MIMDAINTDVPLKNQQKTVAIIYNLKKGILSSAPDAEAEYDSISTVHAIKRTISKLGYKVILLEADVNLCNKLKNRKVDFAFNIAEGLRGRAREAQTPIILDMFGIPYSGSDATTLAIALDKALTKKIVASEGVATAEYFLFNKNSKVPYDKIQFPVIVKPNAEGSSKGIADVCVANNKDELQALLDKNFVLYDGEMLVERFLSGREFTVGLLGNGKKLKVFPPMEICYKKKTQDDFCVYSFGVKQNYKEYIDYKCPSDIDKKTENKIIKMSKKVFDILGCRDFARMDFRLDQTGKPYFIEINPLPGLAPHYSDFPMLAEFCGVSHKELVQSIFKIALDRCNNN